ncbi:sensor histidine kinase [Microvirga puerhi]|uniref:histidine kinase n=1 Tax=Microvirga puerhi TaxID=2876078 RepID=A0ABS7VIX6_9HYPH|nr:ATP-binding protein [Microvirga puerhi]MBZ6075121.1 hypothetical protein [Microvirga puerhi]
MPSSMFVNSRVAGALATWLALAATAAVAVAAVNFVRLRDDFETEARTLHRIVSQRADQHDAHLTSLAAVLATPDRSSATLDAVSEAVLRFYPRITAIDVVRIVSPSDLVFSTRRSWLDELKSSKFATIAAELVPGQTAVTTEPDDDASYHLVKRLPGDGSRASALIMTVDGRRLVDTEGELPPETRLALRDPSGREFVQLGVTRPSAWLVPGLAFEKALGSRSQPLLLQVVRRPTLGELLPPLSAVLVAAITGIGVLLAGVVLRERRAAKEARQRASFHEHQARLAHAMRVNTVGEMASGIAHELTQPLTAILSRSQAGLRVARSEFWERSEIVDALEANVHLAKRAGDILARLRAYVSNSGPMPEPTNLNQLVRNVADLVRSDLGRRGIILQLALTPDEPISMIDRVSIEQVVHNLVRNAADAIETMPQERRTVLMATAIDSNGAAIIVTDRGLGIPPADLPRLFEPFFTTKPEGMGLGLPLCERLVENFSGRITAANGPVDGAIFTVHLPLLAESPKEAAE